MYSCMNFLIVELNICGRCAPYVTNILQHCELKRMSPLNYKSLAECKTKVLYCVWKGQLFIQGQQVCDIALRSPSSGSIPAQLPAKLEIRYVIDVSELRKKLPEAAFGKNTCANDNKACNRDILFSLYEVEFFSQEEVKVDQLIESLKEKDLALVKYLNDQVILLLLASSTLLRRKDSESDESSSCLQALFLISSQSTIGLTAKDLNCNPEQHERASQVALVLPGLRYALGEAAKQPDKDESPPGSVVERHIQDFAKLGQDSLSPFDKLDSLPSNCDLLLKKSGLEAVPEKCSPNSFSRLQFYLSDPGNYTLELAATVAYFRGHSQSPSSTRGGDAERSVGLHSDSLPPGVDELARPQHAVQSNSCSKNDFLKMGQISDMSLLRNKWKSRRLKENSKKKWPPLKALCNSESCKKQTKIRKKSLFISSSKITRPQTDCDAPTVKLKNLQYPLRGKRGAEVLSAEFVQRPRCELATSEGIEQKKPRPLKHTKDFDVNKVTSEDKINKRRPIKKNVHHSTGVISLESRREAGNKNDPFDERTATQDVSQTLRKNEYDSHALNMLADLALSSCNSISINNGNTPDLPCNPSQDCHHLQKGEILHKSSDHEYHRVTKKRKGMPISVQTCPPFLSSSGPPDLSEESLSSSQEGGQVNHNKKRCVKSSLTKSHTVLAKKAGVKQIMDSSTPSLISSEHSYASTVLELSKKQLLLKGTHNSLNSKNGVKNSKSGSLVGKVLPFRHQQNICQLHKQFKSYIPLRRRAIMAARLKENFSKFHKVTCYDETVKVTCQWEAEYHFSLDSKYTNDSLEKTVMRAVHGPWDVSMTDDEEEMKLILHMWIALFYSRPVSSPTVRNVVEHSNPTKYVSLNSVVDPLEPLDDHGASYSLEKCPADSLSEVDQAFSRVEERACSPSEKPLSCNELSSTNCIESEPPLCVEKPSDLPLKDDQVDTTTSNSEATIHSFDKVAGEDSEDIIVLDPVISVNSLNGSSSEEHTDGQLKSHERRTNVEAKANQAVNFAEVSQSDTASVPSAFPADKQTIVGSRTAGSVESQEIDSRSPYIAEGWCCQTTSVVSPNTSEEPWLETSAECRGGDGQCREVGNLTGLSINEERDVDGEIILLESIGLVLSESNDADSEPPDTDIGEENKGLSEKSFVTEGTEAARLYDASSNNSRFTLITPSASVFVHQESHKKGTELHENHVDPIVSASSSLTPNRRGWAEGFCPLQEDQGQNGVDLVSQQACAVHQTTLEEITEPSQTEAKLPIFPNQMYVVEGTCICQDDEGINLDDSPSRQANPVHQTTAAKEAELSRNKKNVMVSTKPLKSSNKIILIEGISQEDMADPAQLQTCELHSVESGMPTQEESRGSQQVSIAFAQHVTPSEQLDLVEGVSISKEEEGFHLSETMSLQASESDKVQNIAVSQEEQTSELQNSSPDTKEKQKLGLNTLVPEAKSEDENTEDLSVTGCGGDKLNQATVTLSEDIRSLLNELIDTVSALMVREETCSKLNSDLNWSSFILEYVTPPESDEESWSADPKLITNEHFKQNCVFDDQMTDSHANVQGLGWCHSRLHESVISDQANTIERGLVQENETASSVSSCMKWTKIGTGSQEYPVSVAETPLSKCRDSSVSVMCEADLGPASYEASISKEHQVRKACVEISPCLPGEHHIAHSSEEYVLPVHGDAGASLTLEDSENPFDEQLERERAHLPIRAMDTDVHLEENSPAEDNKEPFEDPFHRSPPGSSYYTSLNDSPGAARTNYVCSLNPEEEIHKNGDWMYLENKRMLCAESETNQCDWPEARKHDRSISPALNSCNDLEQLKYINFSVTKKHKDKTRTFHSSKGCDTSVGETGLIKSLSRTWRILDDPIQSMLDMECLRFHYKLNETLARNNSQLSTSSNICANDFSPRERSKMLCLREAAAAIPAPSLPAKTQTPLLITIINPGPRQEASGWYPRSSTYTDFLEPPSACAVAQESAACHSQGQEPFLPFHLNERTYNNKLKDSRGDISVIMDEFAKKMMKLDTRQTSNKRRDPSSTSEGAPAPEKRCSSLPHRTASFEALFKELCETLHFRLKHVGKEACKIPYVFYLVETDDDPFFRRLKNLLKKGGHTEADPLHFLKASNPETDRLKVIIRNEDIFPHIYKIPSLLSLKHLPSVTFVGVDSPEDILDNTYQELFHCGGFVVSDDSVLQAMTVGELKSTVKTLEMLNGHGRWRWLLHYKETKKLREDTRVDSAAHSKDVILRSCQGANIMEVLHYHQCDSKSAPCSEYLKCLLNLQVQHIQQRFAVLLTEKPRANREVLESKGILALDVSTFIETAQDMTDPFKTGC